MFQKWSPGAMALLPIVREQAVNYVKCANCGAMTSRADLPAERFAPTCFYSGTHYFVEISAEEFVARMRKMFTEKGFLHHGIGMGWWDASAIPHQERKPMAKRERWADEREWLIEAIESGAVDAKAALQRLMDADKIDSEAVSDLFRLDMERAGYDIPAREWMLETLDEYGDDELTEVVVNQMRDGETPRQWAERRFPDDSELYEFGKDLDWWEYE